MHTSIKTAQELAPRRQLKSRILSQLGFDRTAAGTNAQALHAASSYRKFVGSAEQKQAIRKLLLATLALISMASCTPYRAQPATLLRVQSAATSAEKQGLVIGVTPYLDTERNNQVFGGDLKKAGVLPLQVVVRNDREHPVLIRASNFALRLPGKTDCPPAAVTAVTDRLESYESSAGVVGSTILFGLAGYLLSSTERDKAREARKAELRSKELQDAPVDSHQSTNGFLFFLIPDNVQEVKEAAVAAEIIDPSSGDKLAFELRLQNLGTWNDQKRP